MGGWVGGRWLDGWADEWAGAPSIREGRNMHTSANTRQGCNALFGTIIITFDVPLPNLNGFKRVGCLLCFNFT